MRRQVARTRSFTIYGFQPTPAGAQKLASADGRQILSPDLPDLRRRGRAALKVVVLPFVSGGGVKNKLLEAAAMGKAHRLHATRLHRLAGFAGGTYCSAGPHACASGITAVGRVSCGPTPNLPTHRLGDAARQWVTEQHTWQAAARSAAAGLESHCLRARTFEHEAS